MFGCWMRRVIQEDSEICLQNMTLNDGLHTAGLQSPNDLMHQSSDVLKTCSSLIKLSLRLIKSRSAHMFLHIFALLPWMYLYNTIFAPLNMKPQTRGGLAQLCIKTGGRGNSLVGWFYSDYVQDIFLSKCNVCLDLTLSSHCSQEIVVHNL